MFAHPFARAHFPGGRHPGEGPPEASRHVTGLPPVSCGNCPFLRAIAPILLRLYALHVDKLIQESEVHSAVVAYCLEHLYAARRVVDEAAEATKEDTLYGANEHLDLVAAVLARLLRSA